MRMNSLIALQGDTPDIVGNLARGQAAGHRARQSDIFREHGAGIAAGNKNALAALAGIDPQAAIGVQSARQGMKAQQELMGQRRAASGRAAQAHEAQMSAVEAQQQLERAIGIFSQAQSPEQFDQLVRTAGHEDLIGQFGNRQALLAKIVPIEEKLRMQIAAEQEQAPDYRFKDGQYWDANNPQAGASQIDGFQRRKEGFGAVVSPDGTFMVGTGDAAPVVPQTSSPDKGMQRVYDPETESFVEAPIPGSKIDEERKSAATASDLAMSDYSRKAEIVNSNLDKAISSLEENGRWVAGVGTVLSRLPESAARDFQAVLDTVKANLGFEELNAMREASPTGGALGQVTEREIAFLQAIQGNLDAAQSPQQLLETLKEIKMRRAEFAAERQRIITGQTENRFIGMDDASFGQIDIDSLSDAELDQLYEARGLK